MTPAPPAMRYRVLQPLQLPPGVVLGLDEAQLEPRRPWLRDLGGGRVEATAQVCFKAGEVLDIHGDVPAAYPQALQPVHAVAGGGAAAQADGAAATDASAQGQAVSISAPPAPAPAGAGPSHRRSRRKLASGAE